MSYGLGLSQKKRAQQRRNQFFKWVLYLLILAAIGVYGYYEGQAKSDRRVADIEIEVTGLMKENERLTLQARDALNKQNEALSEARAWRARFENEIPKGVHMDILKLIEKRLSEGLEAQRLLSVISVTQNSSNCDGAPEVKRFIVDTAIAQNPSNSVRIAKGAVLVSGFGTSQIADNGKPEAWYDPAQPVKITFTHIGGKTETVESVLPIHKNMLVGADEYRFSIVAGQQSFAQVSATRCDFP